MSVAAHREIMERKSTSAASQFTERGSAQVIDPKTAIGIGGKSKEPEIIPFDKIFMRRIAMMYANDPVLQAAIAPLINLLADATVTVDEEKSDLSEQSKREIEYYTEEVYPDMINQILQSITKYGFVAFRFAKIKDSDLVIPEVVHEELYIPAIQTHPNKSYDFVCISDRDQKKIDRSILVVGTHVPPLNGEVNSPIRVLLNDYEDSVSIRATTIKIDTIASQNIAVCEKTVTNTKDETNYGQFADISRFAVYDNTRYAANVANVNRFRDHEMSQRIAMAHEEITPPNLYPVPDHYKLANLQHPTTRTNIEATEKARRATVLAVLGVPEGLVYGGSQHAASVIGAYRIMNATLTRNQHLIGDVLQAVHAHIFKEDGSVKFNIEVPGLIAPESVETAYNYDIITPETMAHYFLKAANIPTTAINPEVKDPLFKMKKLRDELKIRQMYEGPKNEASATSSSSSSKPSSSSSGDKSKSKSDASTAKPAKSDDPTAGTKRKSEAGAAASTSEAKKKMKEDSK